MRPKLFPSIIYAQILTIAALAGATLSLAVAHYGNQVSKAVAVLALAIWVLAGLLKVVVQLE